MEQRAATMRESALRALLWPGYMAVAAVVFMRWADLPWQRTLQAACAAFIGAFVVDLAIKILRTRRSARSSE